MDANLPMKKVNAKLCINDSKFHTVGCLCFMDVYSTSNNIHISSGNPSTSSTLNNYCIDVPKKSTDRVISDLSSNYHQREIPNINLIENLTNISLNKNCDDNNLVDVKTSDKEIEALVSKLTNEKNQVSFWVNIPLK